MSDALVQWGTYPVFHATADQPSNSLGLESLTELKFDDLEEQQPSSKVKLGQGSDDDRACNHFRPVSIVMDGGVYYVTLYVCSLPDESRRAQELMMWLDQLKSTDHIKLSVTSLYTNIPYSSMIMIMGALVNTKAKVEIMLDHIVFDEKAYFYLASDVVSKREGGALLVPSYASNRPEDASVQWRAAHDFYHWVIINAKERGILTDEEVARLEQGKAVTIPDDRFTAA